MTTTRSVTGRVLAWILCALLLALYIYAVIAAIGNWQGMSQIAAILSDGLSAQGTFWLGAGVALPALILFAALIAGKGQTLGKRLLFLALGLTILAVLQLDILYFVPTTSYFGEVAI